MFKQTRSDIGKIMLKIYIFHKTWDKSWTPLIPKPATESNVSHISPDYILTELNPLRSSFLLGAYFDAEDKGDIFLRNVGWLSTGCMVDRTLHNHRCQNLKSTYQSIFTNILQRAGSTSNSVSIILHIYFFVTKLCKLYILVLWIQDFSD
jgi:hypothetical protein